MRYVTPTLIAPVMTVDCVPIFGSDIVKVYAPADYDLGRKRFGYFWDTKNRAQNDCVHTKFVDSTPRNPYRVAAVVVAGGTLKSGQQFCCEGAFRDKWYLHRLYEYSCCLEKVNGVTSIMQYAEETDCRTFQQRTLPGRSRQYALDPGTQSFTFRVRSYRYDEAEDRLYYIDQILLNATWRAGMDDNAVRITDGVLDELKGLVVGHYTGIIDKWYESSDELLYAVHSALFALLSPYLSLASARRSESPSRRWGKGNCVVVAGLIPVKVESDFLFEEPAVIRDQLYPSDRLAAYWQVWLKEHAYYDALDSAPIMSDNNLANIAELVSFIRDLVVKHEISMPRSLQDAWLAYRYSYQTTKSDIEEAIEFVHRELDLSALESAYLQCYGMATTTYKGVSVTCRCTLKLCHREMGYLRDIWFQLYKYGLQPNFYTLWDSLPYSFMVDWFIPMGDIASVMDASANYCGDTFDIKDVVFSLQYTQFDRSGRPVSYYSRWAAEPLVSLNAMYWFDKPAAADKTWVCRFLDAASLFIR